MSINTEAAELLHAVADLYECGALTWVRPEHSRGDDQMPLVVAVLCASRELSERSVMLEAFAAVMREANANLSDWQRQRGGTTADVIALLRKAAQRLEEA